jgi:hypothetical protein
MHARYVEDLVLKIIIRNCEYTREVIIYCAISNCSETVCGIRKAGVIREQYGYR